MIFQSRPKAAWLRREAAGEVTAHVGVRPAGLGGGGDVAEVGAGGVEADRPEAADAGRPDRVARNIPLGRAGEPGEIAPAIAWLLGPEASYVTGAVLRVAGGL